MKATHLEASMLAAWDAAVAAFRNDRSPQMDVEVAAIRAWISAAGACLFAGDYPLGTAATFAALHSPREVGFGF